MSLSQRALREVELHAEKAENYLDRAQTYREQNIDGAPIMDVLAAAQAEATLAVAWATVLGACE